MTRLSLSQVDHLVVLHGSRHPVARLPRIETVCLLLCWRQDMSEEGQSLVALPQSEGVHNRRHISSKAGSHGPPHDWSYTENHPHSGCKVMKIREKCKRKTCFSFISEC